MTRILALGHAFLGDDGAALVLARRLPAGLGDVRVVGRPGVALLELLDPEVPTVLLDVVRAGTVPGTVVRVPLEAVQEIRAPRASSHGFGPADALALARVLGRRLPRGWLVGVEGERFDAGDALSPAVEAAMDRWRAATVAAVEDLCTSTGSSIGS